MTLHDSGQPIQTASIEYREGQRLKTISPDYEIGTRRAESIKCLDRGCPNTTKGGKDYCSEHVYLQPYVKAIAAGIDKYYSEVSNIKKGQFDSVELHTQDVLSIIDGRGYVASGVVAKTLQLPHKAAKGFFRHLAKIGLISLVKTDRGRIVIKAT